MTTTKIPLQETFDTVVAHLRKQGKKAQDHNNSAPHDVCRYRTDDGLSCPAGCLIPDDLYRPAFEGEIILPDCPDVEPSRTIAEIGHNLQLVRSLQLVHDYSDINTWECELVMVADQFNLTYTPPTKEESK